jgi:hypothetical protein
VSSFACVAKAAPNSPKPSICVIAVPSLPVAEQVRLSAVSSRQPGFKRARSGDSMHACEDDVSHTLLMRADREFIELWRGASAAFHDVGLTLEDQPDAGAHHRFGQR